MYLNVPLIFAHVIFSHNPKKGIFAHLQKKKYFPLLLRLKILYTGSTTLIFDKPLININDMFCFLFKTPFLKFLFLFCLPETLMDTKSN